MRSIAALLAVVYVAPLAAPALCEHHVRRDAPDCGTMMAEHSAPDATAVVASEDLPDGCASCGMSGCADMTTCAPVPALPDAGEAPRAVKGASSNHLERVAAAPLGIRFTLFHPPKA